MKKLISLLLCAVLIAGCGKQRQNDVKSGTAVNTIVQKTNLEPTPSPSPIPNMKDLPARAKGIAWQTWDWAKAHWYIIATVVQVAVLAILAYKYIEFPKKPAVINPEEIPKEYIEFLVESLKDNAERVDTLTEQNNTLQIQSNFDREQKNVTNDLNKQYVSQNRRLLKENQDLKAEIDIIKFNSDTIMAENQQLRKDILALKKNTKPKLTRVDFNSIAEIPPVTVSSEQQINKLTAEVNHLQKNLNEAKELNGKLQTEKVISNLKTLRLNIKNSAAQLALKKKSKSLAESNVSLKTANDTLDAQNKQLIDQNKFRMQERKKLMQRKDFEKMRCDEFFRENRALRARLAPLLREVVKKLSNLQVFEVQEVEELV
jgi:hypothetical protein